VVTSGAGTATTAGEIPGEAQVRLTPEWAPTIASPASVDCVFETACTFTVTTPASGYPVAALTLAGALPAGMTFTDKGDGTANLSGTPSASGTFPLTVTAVNGVPSDAVQTLTVTVDGPPPPDDDVPPPDDLDPPPLQAGGPAPLPTLLGSMLKPDKDRRLSLTLACPANAPVACAGAISVTGKKFKVLAGTYEIAPSETQTLTKKASKKLLRALAHKRKIKCVATVAANASGNLTAIATTYDVTVKRGRAKRS
jgi:hypothetical protein